MLPMNDVEGDPLARSERLAQPPLRQHRVSLCCAQSVEPMVSEVAHALSGLGFSTSVVCGATARASLLGAEADDDTEPTIHVVCVQGQLRDRVLKPLRQALATRDRPNQHLFVALLDLAMPLSMVGQIRRFAESLERPLGEPQKKGGAERRQWREHFGARVLAEVPTRDYRPLQVVDRTAAADPSAPVATPRRRRRFAATTGKRARVGSSGKYKAITAGRVEQSEPVQSGAEAPEATTPETTKKTAPAAPAAAQDRDRTSRYRIDDGDLVDSIDSLVESGEVHPDDPAPPRIGLASLLLDGPLPPASDGSMSIPIGVGGTGSASAADANESSAGEAAASATAAAMARLELRKKPPMAPIVERPTKASARGERGVTGPLRAVPPTAAVSTASTDLPPETPTDADEAPVEAEAVVTPPKRRPSLPAEVEPEAEAVVPQRPPSLVGVTQPSPSSQSPVLWFGVAIVALLGVGWFAFRGPDPEPAPKKAAELPTEVRASDRPSTDSQPAFDRKPEPLQPAPAPPAEAVAPAAPVGSEVLPPAIIDPSVAGAVDDAAPDSAGAQDPAPDRADVPADADPYPDEEADGDADADAADAPSTADIAARLATAADRRRIIDLGTRYVVRPPGITTSWNEAVRRCHELSVDGVAGWRLPWRKQLKTIAAAMNFDAGTYWSRSPVEEDDDMAWALHAASRELVEFMKSEVTGAVLCALDKPK